MAAEEASDRVRDLGCVRHDECVIGSGEHDVFGPGQPREDQVPDFREPATALAVADVQHRAADTARGLSVEAPRTTTPAGRDRRASWCRAASVRLPGTRCSTSVRQCGRTARDRNSSSAAPGPLARRTSRSRAFTARNPPNSARAPEVDQSRSGQPSGERTLVTESIHGCQRSPTPRADWPAFRQAATAQVPGTSAAAMLAATAATVACSSSVGVNSMTSVPAVRIGVCPAVTT